MEPDGAPPSGSLNEIGIPFSGGGSGVAGGSHSEGQGLGVQALAGGGSHGCQQDKMTGE
jgi:hypothetical protein